MRLYLVRHGNTFEAGETPVRVGANEDLPLTREGEAQARRLGEVLNDAGVVLDTAVTGPLQRTRRHAEIVLECLGSGLSPAIDVRLKEIDYGVWGGLSDEEIVRRFGPRAADELAAWERDSRWPTETAEWRPGAATVRANLRALTAELEATLGEAGTALVCSSNGILRYFLELTPGGLAEAQTTGRAKMGTGAVSMLDVRDGSARVAFWNLKAGTALPQ